MSVPDDPAGRPRHAVTAWRQQGFRRLLAVRVAGQFGDGVFQASLAGAVLFSPERQANAADVAAAFAVLLLPYSVLGPFAGVLLDRWWRQRVLLWANLVRAAVVAVVAVELTSGLHGPVYYATALVAISLARFVLSALSASQPRVISAEELVTGNALGSTLGTVAASAGGGVAIGLRALVGASDRDYALIAFAAAVPYLLAAAGARRFVREGLGPTVAERAARETPAEVLRGLRSGGRVVHRTPLAEAVLALVGVHRLLFGVWTVCTVLLYRNLLTSDGVFRAGIVGLGQLVAAIAIGSALASLVTPAMFRRVGPALWPAATLTLGAIAHVALLLPYRTVLVLASGLVLSFVSQSVKLSVDTVVQRVVGDEFRGRVFAIYDMLFNLALVSAAALTALVLPADGRSPAAVWTLSAAWAVTAVLYLRRAWRPARALLPTREDRATAAARTTA